MAQLQHLQHIPKMMIIDQGMQGLSGYVRVLLPPPSDIDIYHILSLRDEVLVLVQSPHLWIRHRGCLGTPNSWHKDFLERGVVSMRDVATSTVEKFRKHSTIRYPTVIKRGN